MEHYDEVVIKTVRDLFRSYPLVQIKKYIMTKEGDINDKDNELKTLILEKYSSLTEGIEGLEKISSNLNSLENIRVEFNKKINEIDFDKIELALKNISFDNDFFDNLIERNPFNFEETKEKIEKYFDEKNYKEITKEMNIIKEYIDSEEENNKNINSDINIKEKYYFYLIDLVEGIMNKMIEDKNICDNIEVYKLLFDDIFEKLIKNNYEESMEYLIMSELYLKILYEKNIKKIIEEYFYFFKNDNKNFFSVDIILKILFLRVSQILYEISNTPIDLLFSNTIIDKYYNIYQIILCIKFICKKYLISGENEKINLNKFYSFIKSEINQNINSLLVIPKNFFKKLYLHKAISFWNNLYLKNEAEQNKDNENLLEFLFLEKSVEQISNIVSYTLKQYSINNLFNLKIILKNKNIKNENDIFLAISKLKEIKEEKLYKSKFLSIFQNKLFQFFSDIYANMNNENWNEKKENKIEYINIIIKIISYEELINFLNEFNFNEIIQVINEIIEKNQINDYEKIKNYIYDTFKFQLLFELHINEEQKKKYKLYSLTESLKDLIELLYEYEIKENKHKINLYLNIIDIYKSVLKEYISKNGNILLNNIIANDILILKNINIEENNGEQINSLIEQIKNDFKKDINNTNENINNYDGYIKLNNFFTIDEYINNKQDFNFDFNIYSNNNRQIKIEYLPIYVNKMNVFMLNKTKIDYSQRENSTISTCNICDYRIEENYLSIKQDKGIKPDNNTSNSNKNERNNVFGNITGKLFNFINDD